MRKYALILAGGEGIRAGAGMPKQFIKLLGIPMLWWSVRSFYQADPDTQISIVMHPGYFDLWDTLYDELPEKDKNIPVRLVCGGKSRTHSVLNGIMSLPDDEDVYIAVHDAARPLVTPDWLQMLWHECDLHEAIVPVVPEVNSMRKLLSLDGGPASIDDYKYSEPVDRSQFVVVQTPQIFRADILKRAYGNITPEMSFTDDASLVQSNGFQIDLAKGLVNNFKVTNPGDFAMAEQLLKENPD